MIGPVSVAALAPLEYRYALDAAISIVAGTSVLLRCGIPELAGEARQRMVTHAEGDAGAALWVEPLVNDWRTELATIVDALPIEASLIIVASRPMARLLPERRMWSGQALGIQASGIRQLCQRLAQSGLHVEAAYGMHSLQAIGLSLLSQQVERLGRPDLGDRLHFAARLRYCTTGPLATFATVALLVARKRM